ncbi:hypothetical protein NE865_14406 [Phthorimaea operculella]|nr:hypothetical protein NE865_14406 [Phthorimaea operculella]
MGRVLHHYFPRSSTAACSPVSTTSSLTLLFCSVLFWAMGRVLYFHHYFPALQYSCSCMLTGILTEYLLSSIRSYLPAELGRTVYHCLLGVILSSTVYSFHLFSPLAYGMSGPTAGEPNSTMSGLKWLDSWEF